MSAEGVGARLSHLGEDGASRMVDVGGKAAGPREAVAEAWLAVPPAAFAQLLAGIQAAKRTADLIPMCHPLALDAVQVEIELPDPVQPRLRVVCRARVHARTGVEMEAMTGAAVAALTLYDMIKALDKGARIEGLRLLSKSGGKSGRWEAQ